MRQGRAGGEGSLPPPTLRPRHLATLLAVATLASLPGARAALSQKERQHAFIGYNEGEELDPLQCTNLDSRCAVWAAAGECYRNPVFMRSGCLAACRVFPACVKWMDVWRGYATPTGTARYALAGLGFHPAHSHFKQISQRRNGGQGAGEVLTLSRRARVRVALGVGSYLGDADDATDIAVTNAVIRSVAEGINVVDSASNYRSGHGELAVGRALHALRSTSGVERDQLFVSTKAGFTGSPDAFSTLQAAGKISGSDVAGQVHCMHPACLADSLDESLRRLSLTTVDLLYLHNPGEMWLELDGAAAFMQASARLTAAFKHLEAERAAGRIRYYGLATWASLRVPPEHRHHLSLPRVVELARLVGGEDHGFRFVQLPVSVSMPEAWSQQWQQLEAGPGNMRRVSLLDAARELGIEVFGSGPLLEGNLMKDQRLQLAVSRLPEVQGVLGQAVRLLQLARSTPGLLASLIGHKEQAHVEENCQLVHLELLNPALFESAMRTLQQVTFTATAST
eukprot:scaffold6.g2680.t1